MHKHEKGALKCARTKVAGTKGHYGFPYYLMQHNVPNSSLNGLVFFPSGAVRSWHVTNDYSTSLLNSTILTVLQTSSVTAERDVSDVPKSLWIANANEADSLRDRDTDVLKNGISLGPTATGFQHLGIAWRNLDSDPHLPFYLHINARRVYYLSQIKFCPFS